MLMTEQEARTKWCPHYRMFSGNGETGDNRPGGPFNPRCIASGCMAWRQGGTQKRHKENGWVRDNGDCETETVEVGFCGAFGKPGV